MMATMVTRRGAAKLTGLALTITAVGAAQAQALTKPTSTVILTISGLIKNTNNGKTAEFDMPMLEALGTISFTTKTPWYKDPVTFTGVPMSRLIETVGGHCNRLEVIALNDYRIEIPFEDFKNQPVILATKRDSAYMPVRDKGPLFIVYNYDSKPELHHQRFYSRSVWQVARMVVK
jgi:hypothetical protein